MRRNKNEFQLYRELFEAMEESMEKVSDLLQEKEDARRRELEMKRAEGVGMAGTLKGSSQ